MEGLGSQFQLSPRPRSSHDEGQDPGGSRGLSSPGHGDSVPHYFTKLMTNSYTLRAGDLVEYACQPCRVIRVSESAAVIAIRKPARTFTTLSGKRVQFQPKPRTAYISPCSEVEILNR